MFQLFLKLHWIHYDSAPSLGTSHLGPYEGVNRDGSAVGIACGPASNNCAVEGNGRRGPGLQPLPGKVRGKFLGGSFSRAAPGSLFDLSAARAALVPHGGSSSAGTGASLPPTHTISHRHGFGSSAYSASQTPLYSLSSVRISHSSGSGGGASTSNSGGLFGEIKNPKPPVDTSAAKNIFAEWGSSARDRRSTAQFTSSALLPQSSNSSFHMVIRNGVVDVTSVAVYAGGGSASGVGAGQYSWNSAKLMDKDYNLLLKPKSVNVSDVWGQHFSNAQLSNASMLPQSTHSSFSLGMSHGVVDMTTTGVTAASSNSHAFSSNSGMSYLSILPNNGGSVIGANMPSHYSWSPTASKTGRGRGMGDWRIAPEPPQWLPEGPGTVE